MITLMDGCQYTRKIQKKRIQFLINPSNYVSAETEKKLYEYLEIYFKENKWDYIGPDKYELPNGQRIDFMVKGYPDTYIEVKNEWCKRKHVKQIKGYYEIIKTYRKDFQFILLCSGISDDRKNELNHHNINTVLIKDLIL